MGICKSRMLKMLTTAKEHGIRGKSLLMLGKQDISLDMGFPQLLKECGIIDENIVSYNLNDSVSFFKQLGFDEVHALDYSSYEGADIIFNLNDDLPEELHNRFDYIIDGGTMEHCFNCAKVIKNIAMMAKKGGYIFHANPVANYVDHGFYSFSPTFYIDFYGSNNFVVDECTIGFYANDPNYTFYSQDLRLININVNDYINIITPVCGFSALNSLCYKMVTNVVVHKLAEENEYSEPIQSIYSKLYSDIESEQIKFDRIVDFVRNNKVCLYGAGFICEQILPEFFKAGVEDHVDLILDKSYSKVETLIMGKKIKYPHRKNIPDDTAILICSTKFCDEIYSELINIGISKERLFKISDL